MTVLFNTLLCASSNNKCQFQQCSIAVGALTDRNESMNGWVEKKRLTYYTMHPFGGTYSIKKIWKGEQSDKYSF